MPLLEVRNVAKRYGPVVALKSAELVVEPGEIHALLGANGAGKSTLVKILTGVIRHDSGTIQLNGKDIRIGSPEGARRIGLAPVYQDPALLPDLTVAQNMRLTRTPIAGVREWLERMELTVDLTEMTGDLPLPTLRMLDLARALARDPQLLMLDEITAALPSDLAEKVFTVMREWRERGRSVLFISHRLAEVSALCDRASVLRDGRTVGTLVPKAGEEEKIVELMLGETRTKLAQQIEAEVSESEGAVVEVDADSGETADRGAQPRGRRRPRRRLVRGARRRDPRRRGARGPGPGPAVRLPGRRAQAAERRDARRRQAAHPGHPYDAIRSGVVLVPADRMLALLPQRPIRENIATPLYNRLSRWGPINRGDENRRVSERDRAPVDRHARAAPGAPALRRQPAEADDRALAGGRLHHHALLRPHARDRRRHQAPDLRAAARAGRGRRGDPALHLRASRRSSSSATARSSSTAAR